MRAISEHGPATTIEQIAAECGVTKPIVYRTVGDKQSLVGALSELLIDRIASSVSASTDPRAAPRDRFRSAVVGYLAAVVADRNLFLFVNAASPDGDQMRTLVARSAANLIDQFAAAQPGDRRHAIAARTWSHAIVGAFQITALMWLGDEYCDLPLLADDLTDLLWQGITR
jgi:AcrR family transcriptional regulator